MVAALEAGTLDVAALAPIPDAARLKDDPKFQIIETHDIGQFFYASLNVGRRRLDNKLLRQAIAYAIDRKRFTEQIMKGFVGEPRNLPWAIISPAYDAAKNNTYGFDLEKAKSLLAQSGATNVEFDINWALAGLPGRVRRHRAGDPVRPGEDRHQDQPEADRPGHVRPDRGRA